MKIYLLIFLMLLKSSALYALDPGEYIIFMSQQNGGNSKPIPGIFLNVQPDVINAHVLSFKGETTKVTKCEIKRGEKDDAFFLSVEWDHNPPNDSRIRKYLLCLSFKGHSGSGTSLELGSTLNLSIEGILTPATGISMKLIPK